MRCKCGHSFRWTSVSPDEPCCQLHIMEGIRYHGLKKGVWGAPCANATPLTRARLGAYRATIAVGAAPLAAAVAALAAAAIAATAPVWGPVVAVAAVRRRRRRRKARERRRLTHPNFEATRRNRRPFPRAPPDAAARRRQERRDRGGVEHQRSEYRFRRLSHADPLRNTLMVAMPHEHQVRLLDLTSGAQRIAHRTAAKAAADASRLPFSSGPSGSPPRFSSPLHRSAAVWRMRHRIMAVERLEREIDARRAARWAAERAAAGDPAEWVRALARSLDAALARCLGAWTAPPAPPPPPITLAASPPGVSLPGSPRGSLSRRSSLDHVGLVSVSI